MSNYTASFLNFFGKEILDNLGNPIQTIAYSEDISNFRYRKPSIVFSIFEHERKKKEPVIRETGDLGEVEKMGYILVSIPITKEMAWQHRQRMMFKLIKKGSIGFSAANQIKIMPRRTNDIHKVQIDEANLLIRLIGPKSSPTGEGPWLTIGDDENG
jgi:hypothetical protein